MADRKRKLDVFQSEPPGQNGASTVNPYTGRPYSQKYYDILAKRKGEFVAPTRADFLCMMGRSPQPHAELVRCACQIKAASANVKVSCGWSVWRRPPSVAGQGGLRGHDPQAPDDHPGRRDRVRQDHPDRAVHLRGGLHADGQDVCLHAAQEVRTQGCTCTCAPVMGLLAHLTAAPALPAALPWDPDARPTAGKSPGSCLNAGHAPEKDCALPRAQGGGHVGRAARRGRDGREPGRGGRLLHPLRGVRGAPHQDQVRPPAPLSMHAPCTAHRRRPAWLRGMLG